jgi:hypothetical protein
MMQAVWASVVENADNYYQPGVFTTFHGFEWTSHPGGNNMHRIVIFREGADRTSRTLPFSQYDSVDPEDLWTYMASYEEKTGGSVLAISHNGNLSNGLMFDTKTYSGGPLTKLYAETRSRFEPMYEVTQQKGDAEAHPLLSPDDAFADFETLDAGNLTGKVAKTPDMLPKEYARPALLEGLRQESRLGVNPYKFGMVGSTDNGQPHRAARHPRGEQLRQGSFPGAERPPLRACAGQGGKTGALDHGDGPRRIGTGGGLGPREHARVHLGRHGAQGGLCHHRHAPARARLRWLGLRGGRGASS